MTSSLLAKYDRHEVAAFVGQYLRTFLASEKLIAGWQSLDSLRKLRDLVLISDFNVQSDALETMQELFLQEHGPGWEHFLSENAEAVLEVFNDLEHADADTNYFAVREAMKMQYQLLCANRPLREVFSNSKKYLMQTMENMIGDNEGITFEAITLLSVFVLMEDRSEAIRSVLRKNCKNLCAVVDQFEPQGRSAEECADFEGLKGVVREALRKLEN